MSEGWVKLHRSIRKWEWRHDPKTFSLFMALLTMANHAAGKWQGTEVRRGQLITGLKSLTNETGLSIRSVRTSLKRLKSTGEVTIKSTNRFSIITLCNYELYQASENGSDQQSDSLADKRATSKRQANDNKQEEQELKNEKNSLPEGVHPSPEAPKNLRRKTEQLTKIQDSDIWLTKTEVENLGYLMSPEEGNFLLTELAYYAKTQPKKFKKYCDHYLVLLKWRKSRHEDDRKFYNHPQSGPGYYKNYVIERCKEKELTQ